MGFWASYTAFLDGMFGHNKIICRMCKLTSSCFVCQDDSRPLPLRGGQDILHLLDDAFHYGVLWSRHLFGHLLGIRFFFSFLSSLVLHSLDSHLLLLGFLDPPGMLGMPLFSPLACLSRFWFIIRTTSLRILYIFLIWFSK